MKRPIVVIVLLAALAALVYSQRHAFVRGLAEEVRGKMGADSTSGVRDTAADSGAIARDTLAAAEATRKAVIFYEAEALDSAAVYCRKAQRFDPFDPAPCRHLAVVRARQGRPGDALRELEGAVSLDSADVWTWIQLGKIRAQLGEEKQARAAWAQALVLDPVNTVAQSLLEVTNVRKKSDLTVELPAERASPENGDL